MQRGRAKASLAAAMVVAGWLSPWRAAASDATGRWRFEQADAPPEFVDVVQSGSTITLNYAARTFTGTISTNGDYTADAGPAPPPACSGHLNGRTPSGCLPTSAPSTRR